MQFDIVAMIGVILLIGILKRNAIIMIDFALDAERQRGLSSTDAIFAACVMRFSADRDDDRGRAVRYSAADDRSGRRERVSPTARHHSLRRPDLDALQHTGGLSLSGSR
jgi:hypothetical protein